jgi:hypothetical protein
MGPRLETRPCDAQTPSPDIPTACGSARGGATPRWPCSARPRVLLPLPKPYIVPSSRSPMPDIALC